MALDLVLAIAAGDNGTVLRVELVPSLVVRESA